MFIQTDSDSAHCAEKLWNHLVSLVSLVSLEHQPIGSPSRLPFAILAA